MGIEDQEWQSSCCVHRKRRRLDRQNGNLIKE